MNLGRLSINQPILAMVLSIVLLIVGALAYTTLPVSEYPQVVPPTVVVTTQYPGASAQTVSDTVAAPIEQQINGVEDMLYLYSQATSNGNLTITVTFKLGTDLDKAQVLVQNRVAIAQPRLPEEVQRNGIVTRKNSPDILMAVFVLSPDDTFDQLYISDSNSVGPRSDPNFRQNRDCGVVNPGGIQGDAIPLRCDYRRLQALHSGVMMTAMADGSVRGVSANISALTFQRLCTKDLGEALGGDW